MEATVEGVQALKQQELVLEHIHPEKRRQQVVIVGDDSEVVVVDWELVAELLDVAVSGEADGQAFQGGVVVGCLIEYLFLSYRWK